MDYTVEHLPEKGYVRAHITGQIVPQDLRECAVEMFALATAHDCKKILVDSSRLIANTRISDIHRFYSRLGQFGCDRRMSVAIVFRDPSGSDHFVETVARNRGFGLRVFPHLEGAEAWLVGEQAVSV